MGASRLALRAARDNWLGSCVASIRPARTDEMGRLLPSLMLLGSSWPRSSAWMLHLPLDPLQALFQGAGSTSLGGLPFLDSPPAPRLGASGCRSLIGGNARRAPPNLESSARCNLFASL